MGPLIRYATEGRDFEFAPGVTVADHVRGCRACGSRVESLRRAAEVVVDETKLRVAEPSFKPPPVTEQTGRRKLTKALGVVVPALALVLVTGGAAYHLSTRADLLTRIQDLRQQLGVQKPVETEGFVLTSADTIAVTAKIDKRSIQEVIFRPLEGESESVYHAAAPQEGFATVRATKSYSRQGPQAGLRITVTVEFVPFKDLPAELLPPPGTLVQKKDILLVPGIGIVLDPGKEPVWVDIPQSIELAEGFDTYQLQGRALCDGEVAVLLQPVGTGNPWFAQNYAKGLPVRAGQWFMVPCNFRANTDKYEIVVLVLKSWDELGLKEGQNEVKTLPPTDKQLGPLPISVVKRRVTP